MEYDYKLEKMLETIIEIPRDFYLEIYYSLSQSERECYKKILLNKTCMNCTNGPCKTKYHEKTNEITTCIGWDNPELIGKQRILGRHK